MNKANKQFREKYKCPLDGMVNLKMKKPETFDKTRETKIKKISTASSYQTVVQNVHELINRDAILSVNLSDGVQTELSPVTLKSLFASFYKGESLYIFINAF